MFGQKGKLVGTISALLVGLTSSQIALGEATATKVGAKAGMVDVDNLGTAFAIGGYSEIGLSDNLAIRPSIDYWQKSKRSGTEFAEVEVKVSDLTFGGALKCGFGMPGAKAKPYILGGLAMHRLSAEVTVSSAMSEDVQSAETSESEIGFDLGGGVTYPLATGTELNGELMMRSVDTTDFLSITAGLSYKL